MKNKLVENANQWFDEEELGNEEMEDTIDESSSYYSDQLNRLDSNQRMLVKFVNDVDGNETMQTKWMDVNNESVEQIISYLESIKK
jgi:hypothetical protein